MNATPDLIQIKGIRDGLLVTLGAAAWPELQTALLKTIDAQPAFFHGGRLALDIGTQELRVAELSKLRDVLSERSVSLWAVLSQSPVTEATAQNLGLATRISKPHPPQVQPRPEPEPQSEGLARWEQGPIRSGTRLEHPGHIVVMGDVNPGAEIIAGGSVIVWGRLRGVVHAGAQGDDEAVVCALELVPTQLRIAGKIAISPARKIKPQPEIARLENGHLVAEPWQNNTGR